MGNGLILTSGIGPQTENSDTIICTPLPSGIFSPVCMMSWLLSKSGSTSLIWPQEPRNPAFARSSFDSWDFFIWGDLSDLEKLLQKPVQFEDDEYVSKDLLKALIFKVQEQVKKFRQTILYRKVDWPPETPVRIIISEQ